MTNNKKQRNKKAVEQYTPLPKKREVTVEEIQENLLKCETDVITAKACACKLKKTKPVPVYPKADALLNFKTKLETASDAKDVELSYSDVAAGTATITFLDRVELFVLGIKVRVLAFFANLFNRF